MGYSKGLWLGKSGVYMGFSDLKGTQVLLSQFVYRVVYDVQERELITYLIHPEKTTKPCNCGWTHVLLKQTKWEIDLGAKQRRACPMGLLQTISSGFFIRFQVSTSS